MQQTKMIPYPPPGGFNIMAIKEHSFSDIVEDIFYISYLIPRVKEKNAPTTHLLNFFCFCNSYSTSGFIYSTSFLSSLRHLNL